MGGLLCEESRRSLLGWRISCGSWARVEGLGLYGFRVLGLRMSLGANYASAFTTSADPNPDPKNLTLSPKPPLNPKPEPPPPKKKR